MPACGAEAAAAPKFPIGDRHEGQLTEEEAKPLKQTIAVTFFLELQTIAIYHTQGFELGLLGWAHLRSYLIADWNFGSCMKHTSYVFDSSIKSCGPLDRRK
jgi:hypothetical protein